MLLKSDTISLQTISKRSSSEVGDCYICKDPAGKGGSLYVAHVIKDHETVRRLLQIFSSSQRQGRETLIGEFSVGADHVLVFPYHRERPLAEFYEGDSYTLDECEEICINLLLACMTSDLPWPVLYLILKQGEIHLASDRSIFLGYTLDLSELDDTITEHDCTTECARILMRLLKPKEAQKAVSYYLLEKKSANDSYDSFTDLYRDVTIATTSHKKVTWFTVFKMFMRTHSDQIMGVLFWICLILGIIALSIFISRFFLGGSSWVRLLFNTFKQIGKESLLQ